MRLRAPRIASLLALVAALVLGYAFGADRGREATPAGDVSGERVATSKARTSHVSRGPRGPRGVRGPRGPRGIQGVRGPAGRPGGDAIKDLTINWRGGAWSGRDGAQLTLAGVGTLAASCRPLDGDENGHRQLVLTPSDGGVRTVMTVTRFDAQEARTNRYSSGPNGSAITIELPVNGMLTAVLSVEPVSGDGGAGPTPVSLTASSETKLNGPGGADSAENFCYLAVQAARGD